MRRRAAIKARVVARRRAEAKRKPQEPEAEQAPPIARSLLLERMAADAEAPRLSPRQMLDLHERHGNAAVSRLVESSKPQAQVPQGGQLQRQAQKEGAGIQRSPEDEASPEQQFLEDMESGIEKATEYMQYISDAVDYWEEYGGAKPGALLDAAQNLKKISEGISGGLEKAAKPLKLAQKALKIKKWAEDVADFADKTASLDIHDKASRDAWIASTETLADSSKPFVEAAQSWLTGLAIEGSGVAARASVVLSVVGAYAQVGWAALKAGLKAVESYTNRFGFEGTEMKKIEEAERGREVPPEPAYPGDWMSAAEKQAMWDQMLKDEARRKRLEPFYEKLRAARAALEQAKQRFDDKAFLKIYRRNRGKILYKILRELKVGKLRWKQTSAEGSAIVTTPVDAWWECLVGSDKDAYFDEVAGRNIYPRAERVNAEEAQFEIDSFKSLPIPCPYFDDLYIRELEKFLTKERAAVDKAAAELSSAQAQ